MENLTYDWNLENIYKNEDEFFADYEKYKNLIKEKNERFNGKIKSKKDFLDFLNYLTQTSKINEKFMGYLMLRESLNGKDEFTRKVFEDYTYFTAENNPKSVLISNQLYKFKNSQLLEWSSDPDFKDYNLYLKDIIENKKHKQPVKVEVALSQNTAFGLSYEAFDKFNNVDLKFGFLNTPEGKVELTHATYEKLIEHPDQNVRLKAFHGMNKVYKNFNYTLGSLYLGSVNEHMFFVKMDKYRSVLESDCLPYKVNTKILPTLIKVVNNNLNLLHRFANVKKNFMQLKKYYMFDNHFPVGKFDRKFTYDEATDIVCDALQVLGKDYVDIVRYGLTNGWVDVYEKPSKTSGGYSLGIYGVHPYILLNYAGTYDDVSALAHEFGHTMHSYLSDKNQPIWKSNYSIFVAEVASTVNEIILLNHMMNNCENKQEKLFVINQFLIRFYGTIYCQTMYSEFEHFVYTSKENKKPIIVEDLNRFYGDLKKKYAGKAVNVSDIDKYGWSMIPHFYSPYYVYKYATGFISASIIAKNLINKTPGYHEKYMKFLSAGSSEYPIELLKSVDVDLTKEKTLQSAFSLFEEYLDQFEDLTREVKLC